METNDDSCNQREVFVVELEDVKKAKEKQEKKQKYDPYLHREVDHPTT